MDRSGVELQRSDESNQESHIAAENGWAAPGPHHAFGVWHALGRCRMCRNIKTLHHFEPPATEEEVRASALQYVRKLTGMNSPSRVNQKAFNTAVEEITALTLKLFDVLEVHTPPRSREAERLKVAARGRTREEQLRAKYAG